MASRWRGGRSGANLIFSAASTPFETVTIAARALMRPRVVSISTKLRVDCMRVTATPNCTGRSIASFASSAPKPWRQNASVSRSSERAKSTAETSSRFLAQPNGPSTNSTAGRQSPRSFGSACMQATSALPRAASWMARFARTIAAR